MAELRARLREVAKKRVDGGALIGGAMIGGRYPPMGGYFRQGRKNGLWYERKSRYNIKHGFDPYGQVNDATWGWMSTNPRIHDFANRYRNTDQPPGGYFTHKGVPLSQWQGYVAQNAGPLFRQLKAANWPNTGDKKEDSHMRAAAVMGKLASQARTLGFISPVPGRRRAGPKSEHAMKAVGSYISEQPGYGHIQEYKYAGGPRRAPRARRDVSSAPFEVSADSPPPLRMSPWLDAETAFYASPGLGYSDPRSGDQGGPADIKRQRRGSM